MATPWRSAAFRWLITGTTPAEVTFQCEMGYTPAECQQKLPAVASFEPEASRMRFDHIEDGKRYRPRLIYQRRRAITYIRLPTYAQNEIDLIPKRFHAQFRRDGG